MGSPLRQDIVRELRRDGWQVRITRGGHLVARHPSASMPVYLPATPSDWRSDLNTRAQARRALRGERP